MKSARTAGKRRLAIAGVIILAAVSGIVLVQSNTGRGNWPSRFQSNGERIYFTGTSASGSAITRRDGAMGMGRGMSMTGGGCVTCHGVDRQGTRLMPQFWLTAPSLTPEALFGEHDETQESGGHGDHEDYTDDTLRRAITQGVDPGGKALDKAMPHWSMSSQNLDDLIAFLKSPAGNHD